MPKKSILMITEEMIPPYRRFCITQRSAEYLASEFNIHLVYLNSPFENLESNELNLHPVYCDWNQFKATSRISAQIKLLNRAIQVCQKNRIDLIYGWWIPGYAASLLSKTPSVWDMPEFGEEMYRTFAFPFRKAMSMSLYHYQLQAAKHSKAVITESDIASYIWKKRGVPEQKLHSIPYGIEVDFFADAEPDGVRERYGIPFDAILLLYQGDIGYDDGVDILMRAIKDLDVWCMCVGSGPQRYMNYLRLLSNEKTSFTGWISYKEMPKIVKSADICVSPFRSTLYTDTTFPLKIMEGMASGKASVATELKAFSKAVTPNKDIKLVKPGNEKELRTAIDELVTDERLRKKIGANGQKTAKEKFDWRLRAKQEQAIFRNVLE